MRKFLFASIICTLALALSSCQDLTLVVNNGELLGADLSFIQPYLGNYAASRATGIFTPDQKGSVQFALQGNRPLLVSSVDLLGEQCGSSIGPLKKLEVLTDSDQKIYLVDASFNLDVGKCTGTFGRTVDFKYLHDVFGNDHLTLSILVSATRDFQTGELTQHFRTWEVSRAEN